jgi:type II secretory pathway predicted ATPase ExeA
MTPGYESFFGLVERPFSLTPDVRYFFKNSSHGRILETLTFGLRRREPFLLVAGDLGVGKTILGRVLTEQLRRKGPVSFVSNPLVTPEHLFRLLAEDFNGIPAAGRTADTTLSADDHFDLLTQTLAELQKMRAPAVAIIDDANRLPAAVVEQLMALALPEPGRDLSLQVVLLGQPPAHAPMALGNAIDERIATRGRLVAFSRDECVDYIGHRLRVAGASARPIFSTRAIDVLFGLSNGLPRLVNLLCERALQDAAAQQAETIEASLIASAASALELSLARPRRFRWFSKRVS